MYSRLKISHHSHSGRLRPHEFTSYIPLFSLLVIVGLLLSFFTAAAAPPGPMSGSVGLTGEMPGPPPKTAATIDNPRTGQRFTAVPIPVSGTCPKDTLVEIFANDIFAGSTGCAENGTYSLEIGLLIDQNVLVARVFDALNQQGPDSNSVTVSYDALPPQASPLAPLNFQAGQLLLSTDAVYRGMFPDKEFNIPVTVLGGTPPYAINVQWGDSNNKVIPRNDNQSFRVPHTYKKPGVYQVTLQATDAQERVAFMSVASIVNGQPDPVVAAPAEKQMNKFIALWPFYVAAVAVVIAFWLGERREKRILGATAMQRPPIQYHQP